MTVIILIAVIVILAIWIVSLYNSLVQQPRERICRHRRTAQTTP